MRFSFYRCARPLLAVVSVVLLFVMVGCGNSTSIVGKWRLSGTDNQIVWEFLSNGSVLAGDVRGRYKLGTQDRIKIETPFSTSVYVMSLSSDQLVLQEPGGSKLELTRVQEGKR